MKIPPQEDRPLIVPALVVTTLMTGYLQKIAQSLRFLPFSQYMEGENVYCLMGVYAASSGLDNNDIDIKVNV